MALDDISSKQRATLVTQLTIVLRTVMQKRITKLIKDY